MIFIMENYNKLSNICIMFALIISSRILEPAPHWRRAWGRRRPRKTLPDTQQDVPKKLHGLRPARVSEIDQLVRFGGLTKLCVSAFLLPDLTSVEVSDTHKNLKNKRNVTMS